MAINLDVVIDSDDNTVDMKAGLDSMQGVSDAVRFAAETILTEHTPQRHTHKAKVRTTLKKSFKGSYGHIFSIDINDNDLLKRYRKIGSQTFIELISYFMSESLYQESIALSPKTKEVLESLGETAEDLVEQLRKSALENIHEVSTKFNQNVKIRYRKSRDKITTIASFNRETSKVLTARTLDDPLTIEIMVTRLNIHTGNGRLQLKGSEDTVAFGFGIPYKVVAFQAKKVFSENLDQNNGTPSDKWKYLKIQAKPIKQTDGKIIKYIVTGLYEN